MCTLNFAGIDQGPGHCEGGCGGLFPCGQPHQGRDFGRELL